LPTTFQNLRRGRISFGNNLVSYLMNNSIQFLNSIFVYSVQLVHSLFVKLCCVVLLVLCAFVLFVAHYDQFHVHCIYTYCDVFGRMPPLLCNRKLETPAVAMQPKVRHLSLLCNRKLNTYMDTLATRYCCVAWLPSNCGRVFPLRQQYTTVSQFSLRSKSVFGFSVNQSTPMRE
jgi:hypothetical protein